MSLIVAHNLSAMQTNRNLGISTRNLATSLERLSSGYKINTGADDPSGLIISEQLRTQISGLNRAIRNSSEAMNLIGIAEGALNEMNEILKKLRALAIHAANSGVTSPEQVAADQSEVDSGIQTLDRIANTTRYSDQFLLNGSKQLVFDRSTVVDDPMDNALINLEASRIDQIFKRQGVKVGVSFAGVKNKYQANTETEAKRAYMEAEANNPLCQISGNKITAKQEFILTGTLGTRLFSFAEGTNLGTIVSGINNVKDSTGVGATLIFASNVRIDSTKVACTVPPNNVTGACAVGLTKLNTEAYQYVSNHVQVYKAGLNNTTTAKISSVTITPLAANAFMAGYNMDGDGKIYAKVVDKANNVIEWYKDKDCTMLIGKGDDRTFAAANNSGIPGSPQNTMDGLYMKLTTQAENLDVYEIALVGQDLNNQKDMSVTGLAAWVDIGNAVMSGVNLGTNTSSEGQLFFRYTPTRWNPTNGETIQFKVEAFSDSSMQPQYLVASSGLSANHTVANLPQTVRLESVTMANGLNSNLNMTFNIPSSTMGNLPRGEQVGSVSFTNVGIRLYANNYGSDQTIRIQNKQGDLFYYFREGDTMEKVMVQSGTTVQIAGQDAQIGLNGAPILTTGLIANITTPDFSGKVAFNAGKLGLTTMAVAGYEYGSLYSKATALQAVEENEIDIFQLDRSYIPPASTAFSTTVVDQANQPISFYLDFSNLDETVMAKLNTLNTPLAPSITYTAGTANTPPSFSVSFDGLTTANIPVDVDNLHSGFYLQDPNLKGLFIKSSAVINTMTSTTGTTTLPDITVTNGDRMLKVMTYATNARHNTSENLFNFLGGMQFQLGNTEGDQDRTVYSIPSMVMANVGRLEWDGQTYYLQDVLGGGVASLARDPILAMRVLTKAVDDVATLRARLGAFTKNMLQTNINSLEIAVDNIQKTESAIRDTDMATESTEYTKNQIMQQAGTSMLAQANQINQNVLSLLQR